VPDPGKVADEAKRAKMARSLDYMGLTPGTKISDIPLDVVFIGSCTNGRIEDLRNAANIVKGKKVSSRLAYAMIVPGSGLVKAQAEQEGLDKVFLDAGFEWREAGCSMCLGLNPDQRRSRLARRQPLEGRRATAAARTFRPQMAPPRPTRTSLVRGPARGYRRPHDGTPGPPPSGGTRPLLLQHDPRDRHTAS
jgi:homoaconitase/3-isopropylmalate dehydratase large subunit